MDHESPGTLVGVREMARRLNVPVSWLYKRTRLGPQAVPFLRLGKYIKFDPEAVLAFFKAHGGRLES